MSDALITVLILGLANGALSQVVTYGAIFRPVRERANDVSAWLGDMLDCSLCFGLWSAFVVAALAVWRLTDVNGIDAPLLWAAGAFAIHGVGLITGHAYRVLASLHD